MRETMIIWIITYKSTMRFLHTKRLIKLREVSMLSFSLKLLVTTPVRFVWVKIHTRLGTVDGQEGETLREDTDGSFEDE